MANFLSEKPEMMYLRVEEQADEVARRVREAVDMACRMRKAGVSNRIIWKVLEPFIRPPATITANQPTTTVTTSSWPFPPSAPYRNQAPDPDVRAR